MYHHAKLKIWLTRLETYIFCSMLQCHNIVNSKTLLFQFLSYVQETKYCAAGKQADILPDSKIIKCKQTKLLFLIKIS